MTNPLIPSRGAAQKDERVLLDEAQSAFARFKSMLPAKLVGAEDQLPDRIVLRTIPPYAEAIDTVLRVEDEGLAPRAPLHPFKIK